IYGFFWFDRFVLRKRFLEAALYRYVVTESQAFLMMRGAAFLFFAAVSAYGVIVHTFLLTPQLKTDDPWVPWVAAAVALCALDRRTVPGIGLGVAGLFVVAVSRFGIFHLLDYLILLGVSYYFLAARMAGAGWTMSRYVALYAGTALTLLWAAVEKW